MCGGRRLHTLHGPVHNHVEGHTDIHHMCIATETIRNVQWCIGVKPTAPPGRWLPEHRQPLGALRPLREALLQLLSRFLDLRRTVFQLVTGHFKESPFNEVLLAEGRAVLSSHLHFEPGEEPGKEPGEEPRDGPGQGPGEGP